MNWYSIFYWITVADSIKSFLDTASTLFTAICVIICVIYTIATIVKMISISDYGDDSDTAKAGSVVQKWTRSIFIPCLILSFITWSAWILVPAKKDALLIVAGGAVGNFITKDTAAKQIPSEVMTLLRDKIRSEIKEIHIVDAVKDSLEGKTKEELIEILKNKK